MMRMHRLRVLLLPALLLVAGAHAAQPEAR